MVVQSLLRSLREYESGFAKARSVYAKRLAPEFNPIDFIGPDESRFSRILAWMLDPKGSHSQGARFLQSFLHKLALPWPSSDLYETRVTTETWTQNGIVDIQIQNGDRIVAIENKLFAADRDTQLARYFRHYDGQVLTSLCLVYLTPDGRNPSDSSLSSVDREKRLHSKELCLWSYSGDIQKWLSECRVLCEAEHVSAFIKSFADYTDVLFGGGASMDDREIIVDHITSSPENISVALDIILAADAVRERLLAKLQSEVSSLMAEKGLRLTSGSKLSPDRYAGLFIEKSGSEFTFGFEFQDPRCNRLIYGISEKVARVQHAIDLSQIRATFGSGKTSQGWVWYRDASLQDSLLPSEPNWTSHKQPWIAIADGSMAKYIVSAAEKLLSACPDRNT